MMCLHTFSNYEFTNHETDSETEAVYPSNKPLEQRSSPHACPTSFF